jgi:asparagine synthase (glutamine-hydrolysing)
MASEMEHRGPDAAGTWLDEDAGLGFGHRRLSILDLSVRGRQPMVSSDKRWVITYNGEVYNFADLRADLDVKLRGRTDTEVVLESIARFGLEKTVRRCNGMFAFAAWDRERRELHLVRDRLGIKPLYWGHFAGAVLFASQMRPFRRYPGFRADVDRDALSAFLRYDAVPGDRCILEGFHKLAPGHIATFRERDAGPEIRPYWDPATVYRDSRRTPFGGDRREAVDALEELLGEAVGDRMIADVPLGAFLSGGIDSSTVVALMQARSDRPVRTFSIGFHEKAYDEAVHAKEVARHLGTDHTELYLRPDDALDVIPNLASMYDEPFADSSQIPTHLVSALAREHVTVALSGDGGDELFAGYNRHVWGPRVWNVARRVPGAVRKGVAGAVLTASTDLWERVFDRLDPALPDSLTVRLPADKLQKLAGVLPSGSAEELYVQLASQWKSPADVVVGGTDGIIDLPDVDGDLAEQMMLWDLVSYLPDDILTKVDRASMAVSLEARVPLLDHRVVEFAWSLPLDFKLHDGQSKWVLRQVLYRHVPRELVERPKMGFGVPIDRWLRGPLRDWAESLLDGIDGTYLRAEPIRRRWREHLAGSRNWQHHLWDILMFQAWRAEWT